MLMLKQHSDEADGRMDGWIEYGVDGCIERTENTDRVRQGGKGLVGQLTCDGRARAH